MAREACETQCTANTKMPIPLKYADRKDDRPACKVCHVPLTTGAEQKIGVHVSCVHEQNQRATSVALPKPSYAGVRR